VEFTVQIPHDDTPRDVTRTNVCDLNVEAVAYDSGLVAHTTVTAFKPGNFSDDTREAHARVILWPILH